MVEFDYCVAVNRCTMPIKATFDKPAGRGHAVLVPVDSGASGLGC